MELKKLDGTFSVCQVEDYSLADLDAAYCFIGKTEGEKSLVCRTEDVPANATRREDGWRGVRIQGVLDFSLVGVLADIAAVLASGGIPIFAVSTYDTDYIFVKRENFQKALDALQCAGYEVID